MKLKLPNTVLRTHRLRQGKTVRNLSQQLEISDALLSGVELRMRVPWPALRRQLAEYFSLGQEALFDTETGLARFIGLDDSPELSK